MGILRAAHPLIMRCLVLAAGLLALTAPGVAEGQPWLSDAWLHRVSIDIDPTLVAGAGTLSGFPVLLRPSGAQAFLFAGAKADGTDLVVTRGDGVTVLPREIVRWSPGGPAAELWFRADALSDADNRFYLYYGNPDTAVAPLGGSVWGPSHLAVYHFAENPGLGVLWDYGPGQNHGLAGVGSVWTSQNAIAGPIDQAWRFNGTSNWIDGDNITSSDSSFTVSGWFGCWGLVGNSADFALSVGGASPWHLSAKRNESQLTPDFASPRGFFSWNPTLTDTLTHHYLWSMDGVNDTIRFYYDGIEQSYRVRYVAPLQNPPGKVYVGSTIQPNVGVGSNLFGNFQDLMQGIVDEFRICRGTRSPDWVLTEYNNQKQPAAFVTYGGEESRPVGVADVEPSLSPFTPRAHPNPFRRSTMIQFELTGREPVEVTIYAPDGRLVRTLHSGDLGPGAIRLPWDGRGDRGGRAGSGMYFLRVRAGDRAWAGRAVLLD